jgi:hypothetical protein
MATTSRPSAIAAPSATAIRTFIGGLHAPFQPFLSTQTADGTPRATVNELQTRDTSRVDLARYEQLIENASVLDLGGDQIPVASLEDLIRSKEVSDRVKDREALAELRDLRAREAIHERDSSRGSEPSDLGVDL